MDVLDALRECLERHPEVRLAVLFGSAARGESRERSDVDLGLRLVPGRLPDAALEADLGRAAGRAVDLVILDSAPPLLRFEISRDGRVVVERDPHAWSNFHARAMVDWWDWAPTARAAQAVALRRLHEQATRGPA
jgi:predicted nucleotidyltransferase